MRVPAETHPTGGVLVKENIHVLKRAVFSFRIETPNYLKLL